MVYRRGSVCHKNLCQSYNSDSDFFVIYTDGLMYIRQAYEQASPHTAAAASHTPVASATVRQ